ncbi:MAG: universal stress protein [Bacteroidia bacterium]|nr:universal stress protein [Bacteroidia bacterium]
MTSKEKIILAPVDFKEQSLIALSQSYKLAKFTESKIYLIHVIEKKEEMKEATDKLNQLAKSTQEKAGVEVKSIIAKGNPFEEILKAVKKFNPLLVFIGLNSMSPAKAMLGQNAFQTVRECPVPVITIKGKIHKDGCKTILLPLDLTKETREKVGRAIEFAKYFKAKIQVLGVLDKKAEVYENKILSYSNQVKQFIRENGVACGNKTLRGKDVARMIVDYAKEIDADLIMIMSKAELSLKEFFIGTVAQRIVNLSDIPVFSVRPMVRRDTTTFTSPF